MMNSFRNLSPISSPLMNDMIQPNTKGRWTAAHIRPRCEKKVAEFAQARSIPCYLPLVRRCKRYQRRKIQTFIPMFPGYIFACVNQSNQDTLLESNRIARILKITEVEEKRLIKELNDIRILENAEMENEIVVNPEIVTGKPVLITEGPLKGCIGIVERRDQKTRVTVNIELLGNSVSAIIDLEKTQVELSE